MSSPKGKGSRGIKAAALVRIWLGTFWRLLHSVYREKGATGLRGDKDQSRFGLSRKMGKVLAVHSFRFFPFGDDRRTHTRKVVIQSLGP